MHVHNMYVHVQGRLDSSKAWFTLLPDPPLLLHFQFFFLSLQRYAQFDENKAGINTINYHYLIFVTEKSLNYYQLLQCTYWQYTQG